MLRNLTEYHWAERIDEALLLLARLDVRTVALAGGTALLATDNDNIEAVVDLRDLGLSNIAEDVRGMHIGSMTTLQQLTQHPLSSGIASGILSQAAYCSTASDAVRNSATVGGTLALGVAAHADILTVLAALEAQAIVRSGSRTEVSLNGGMLERSGAGYSGIVYKGKQERRLDATTVSKERLPNELIIEVVIPRFGQQVQGAFARISDTPTGVAILNVALVATIEQEQLRRVRVVFGGGDMEPVRCISIEQVLEGQALQAVRNMQNFDALLQKGLTAFRPTTDRYASSGYRKASAVQLLHQVCEAVLTKHISIAV